MTAPRQVLPGHSYLVTRRCSERRFFLRPSRRLNQVFTFLLAVAARRFGVRVHAYAVMSNHLHLIVTDPGARLPAFEQFLDGFLARVMNATLGRREAFWDPRRFSAVLLATPADLLDKAAYVLANPVRAGLVRHGREWPGAWSDPASVGGEALEVERPAGFFRKAGPLPERAALRLVAPPGFESAEAFREQLAAALAARERAAAVARARRGLGFLGRLKILAQRPEGRPPPERRDPRARTFEPRVAAKDPGLLRELLAGLRAFRDAYRAAWRTFAAGARRTVFPAGTYALRVLLGVTCRG